MRVLRPTSSTEPPAEPRREPGAEPGREREGEHRAEPESEAGAEPRAELGAETSPDPCAVWRTTIRLASHVSLRAVAAETRVPSSSSERPGSSASLRVGGSTWTTTW